MVNKGQLLPEFEIASFEAEKGSIVGPILTEYGYHVIKVNDKRTVDSNEQVNASHILLTIQPGRGTENELKDTASIFALEATEYGFFALADSLGLEIQDSNGLRKSQFLLIILELEEVQSILRSIMLKVQLLMLLKMIISLGYFFLIKLVKKQSYLLKRLKKI